MLKIIGSLIFGLILTASVYAEPVQRVIADGPVTPVTEMAVTPSLDLAPPPADAGVPSGVMPQAESLQRFNSLPKEQASSIPQEQALIMHQEHAAMVPQGQAPVVPQNTLNPAGSAMVIEDPVIRDLANRVAALEIENHVLQNQIAQISGQANGRVVVGEQKMCGFYGQVQQQIDNLRNLMGPKLFLIAALSTIAILLLLLVHIIIPRRKNVSASHYPQDELASKDQDFNIMEGKEGIASKLNLARAYIGMGHESKAQAMLYDVLSHGSDAEQEEAKTLLETIKQHSHDGSA